MESLFQLLFKYKPFLFQKGKISFESPLSLWLLPFLLLVCATISYVLYRQRLSPVGRQTHPAWKTFSLLSLRILTLLVLLLALFRPVLNVSTVFPRENIAALL